MLLRNKDDNWGWQTCIDLRSTVTQNILTDPRHNLADFYYVYQDPRTNYIITGGFIDTINYTITIHCIKTKSYIAQKSVNVHSGPDSKVMHSFTTRMRFPQSSVMMMDTSPVHRIWHAKAIYSREIQQSWVY